MHSFHFLAVVFSPPRLKHELFPLVLAARLLTKLTSSHFYPLLWKVGSSLPPMLGFPPNKKGAQMLGIPTCHITSSALPGSLASASFSLLCLCSLCSWFYSSPPSLLLYLIYFLSLCRTCLFISVSFSCVPFD